MSGTRSLVVLVVLFSLVFWGSGAAQAPESWMSPGGRLQPIRMVLP